jgi:hypothetical protein
MSSVLGMHQTYATASSALHESNDSSVDQATIRRCCTANSAAEARVDTPVFS